MIYSLVTYHEDGGLSVDVCGSRETAVRLVSKTCEDHLMLAPFTAEKVLRFLEGRVVHVDYLGFELFQQEEVIP